MEKITHITKITLILSVSVHIMGGGVGQRSQLRNGVIIDITVHKRIWYSLADTE